MRRPHLSPVPTRARSVASGSLVVLLVLAATAKGCAGDRSSTESTLENRPAATAEAVQREIPIVIRFVGMPPTTVASPTFGEDRKAIQAAQQSLMQWLTAQRLVDPEAAVLYDRLPMIALGVDAAGLRKLQRLERALVETPRELTEAEQKIKPFTIRRQHPVKRHGSYAPSRPAITPCDTLEWIGVDGSLTGENTVVIVIDDGVQPDKFSELGERVVAGGFYSGGIGSVSKGVGDATVGSPAKILGTDEITHGTKVAAIVGSVAPQIQVIALRVADDHGIISDAAVIHALQEVYSHWYVEWSEKNTKPVKIAAVCLSLGWDVGPLGQDECDTVDPDGDVKATCQDLWSVGIPVVASSGNDSKLFRAAFPSCLENTISVGAITAYDAPTNVATWLPAANWAPFLDTAAPGRYVHLNACATELLESGTSLAAPQVAAVLALLLQAHGPCTSDQLRDALHSSETVILDMTDQPRSLRLDQALAFVRANCSHSTTVEATDTDRRRRVAADVHRDRRLPKRAETRTTGAASGPDH